MLPAVKVSLSFDTSVEGMNITSPLVAV